MRKVVFLIPGSPVAGFFAQIAAFRLAIGRLTWTKWEPQLLVCMGDAVDAGALTLWRPRLHDVPIMLVPPAATAANPFYYAQIDALYEWAPPDADLFVRVDADTLPVGDLEDVLDYLLEANAIGGVMAHFPFPAPDGMLARDAWQRVAEGLIDQPLDFRQAYSLVDPEAPAGNRVAPFYLNDGVVFIPRAVFGAYSKAYLSLRPRLMDRLPAPYYAGQIALTLAITQIGARTCALPMRYNFPNDERATQRFPEELENVRIFHYLRTDEFDRARIFESEAGYREFLGAPLQRPGNKAFREHVVRLLGRAYPFAAQADPQAPLSKEAYERVCRDHQRDIAPELEQLDKKLSPTAADKLDPQRRSVLVAQRDIVKSGLFDEDFYLEANPDVRKAGVAPLWHYAAHGESEGRRPNRLFSPAYYRRRHMQGQPASRRALAHYAAEGEANGATASLSFSGREYLAAHPKLGDFVDRPLFHYLRIGRHAGLPASTHELPAGAVEALENVVATGGASLEQMMRGKQALVSARGIEQGFAEFKGIAPLSDCDSLRQRGLQGQLAFARQQGEAVVETAQGGQRFVVNPPALVGEGRLRKLEHVSRTLYVARLAAACVRGRSALIEAGDKALLDFEDREFDLFDCELDIDPSVFHAAGKQVWVIQPKDGRATLEVDEAFMLLGPQTGAFGDWMYQSLPRYVAADMSGALPAVPVLIDAGLGASIRQSLEMVLRPGTQVIEVPPFTTVRVQRLWCGSNLHYAPAREKMDARYKFDYNSYNPATFAPVIRELARRASIAVPDRPGPERVFLARQPRLWRKMVNHASIEAAARTRGFAIVYPEELGFADQVALVRGARYVIGPEGSAFALTYFSRPGSKVCVLCHPMAEAAAVFTDILEGVEISVFTGPVVRHDPRFPHRADYQIDERRFCDFLDQWLGGQLPGQPAA